MSDKKLLPADLDPRNPSYAYKNKYNEHVENTCLLYTSDAADED